jgi:outer membrane protein OmpA-like peptidoglycan-associated protein
MTPNEPESPGGWVVDLRDADALQRALESAGGMPPKKGRRRKDPTPTSTPRPTPPGDPADPVAADDEESAEEVEGDAIVTDRVPGEPGGPDDPSDDDATDDGALRTASGDLPRRAGTSVGGTTASAGALPDDGDTDDTPPPVRRGDESLIAQAQLPVSLEQQRRRRQWAIGGTAAVAVVACALLINGLRGSGGDDDTFSNVTLPTAPPSQVTTASTIGVATTAGGATVTTVPGVDPLVLIPTIRDAPAQFGFYLDGQIVLQGTVPSKTKGAQMKLAAGQVVGNDNVNAAYKEDDTVPTVAHPPLYIANPIRFDDHGSLDADSESALQAAAHLLVTSPTARMAVLGFTSAQGSQTDNLGRSQREAEAVVNELVRLGVPREQLFAQGRGETDPMAENTSPKGRAANERIELVVQGLLG